MEFSEVPEELRKLAEALTSWFDNYSIIEVGYLFGSRVRGDHRPESDVDLFLQLVKSPTLQELESWVAVNESDFSELKSKLPGPLALHEVKNDAAWPAVQLGAEKPRLRMGKLICVITPPLKTANEL